MKYEIKCGELKIKESKGIKERARSKEIKAVKIVKTTRR